LYDQSIGAINGAIESYDTSHPIYPVREFLFYINVNQFYYPHAYHEVGLEVGLGRISPPFFYTLFHEEHPVGE